jgi:hypothetical protein
MKSSPTSRPHPASVLQEGWKSASVHNWRLSAKMNRFWVVCMDSAMAYVRGNYDWDIFISYSRLADEPGVDDLKWVTEFERHLRLGISQRLPSKDPVKIYFDERDFGVADHLSQHLLEAARKSFLFLPIVSPRYVAPDTFTMQELDAFCQAGDVSKRIVIIELLPVGADDGRPAALQGPHRNDFYVTEHKTPMILMPTSMKYSDDYYTRVARVAEETKGLLQKERLKNGGKVSPSGKKPFSGKTALLAEKEGGVDREWGHIRDWLHDFGVNVLPDEKYDTSDDMKFTQEFETNLKKADLFIQLLSPVDEVNHWTKHQKEKPSRARLQYDVASKNAKCVPILQWRKPIEISLEAFKGYDKDLLEGSQVVAVGLEPFKAEIKKKLDELVAPPAIVRQPTGKPYVYITADDADLSLALELKDTLESKLKLTDSCEIIAAAKNRSKNFGETIKVADAAVFVYGQGNPEFIDLWLSKYAQLKKVGKAKPPQVDALYRAPPRKTDVKQQLRAPLGNFLLLGSEDVFSAEDIQRIFDELERRKTAAHPGGAAP